MGNLDLGVEAGKAHLARNTASHAGPVVRAGEVDLAGHVGSAESLWRLAALGTWSLGLVVGRGHSRVFVAELGMGRVQLPEEDHLVVFVAVKVRAVRWEAHLWEEARIVGLALQQL